MRRITILALTAVAAAVFAALASAGPAVHRHDMATMGGTTSQALAAQLADARVATAKYANNLALAKKQGYGVITQMIPDMGWHFMNPKITDFRRHEAADPRVREARLDVAARRVRVGLPEEAGEAAAAGRDVRLVRGGLPLQGRDVRVPGRPERVRREEPAVGAAFGFWHPDLVTMHVWAWYPNPAGVYSGMNPLMHPFNKG